MHGILSIAEHKNRIVNYLFLERKVADMSANYWRNRWINALIHNGIKRSDAEEAFAKTYSKQSADHSKSPEIQALMALGIGNIQSSAHTAKSVSQH